MDMKPVAIVLLLGCGLLVIRQPASAAGRKKVAEKTDPAARAVKRVLRAEVAGEVDRRWQLAETLKQQPDSAPARWQAGFVNDSGVWKSFDELPRATAEAELFKQYRVRRDEAQETFAGQMELANWCRKQQLFDRERAHLFVALSLAPDRGNTDLLLRLGYRQICGFLFGRDELTEWHRLNQQADAALKRWESQLNGIARGASGSSRQRDATVAKLRQISDPSAIPAIELTLAGRSEETAIAAVDLFKHMDGPEASVALAKQAVFSKWPEIRKVAGEILRSRTFEDFVAPLISLLAKPVTTELHMLSWTAPTAVTHGFGSVSGGQVVLFYSYVLARETGDQFQVVTLRTADYLINQAVDGIAIESDGQAFRESRGNNLFDWSIVRGQHDAFRAFGDRTEAKERTVTEFNELTDELNGRIGAVLSSVSGLDPSSDPDPWWKWWSNYSDTQQTGNKRVVEVSENETVGNPSSSFSIFILSCFAAGTPVWTETGLVPIENISVGDRVLAKDVETGELTYKTVLQTTVRPPKELMTLRFGDESVVCTGGHRFWNSGQGWSKARDLVPQTLLHTVTGNAPVWSAKNGQTGETFNLVVADFHTYFVGKTGLLCQDLLIPRGTTRVVPGLARK
jgi:hypothetical protein